MKHGVSHRLILALSQDSGIQITTRFHILMRALIVSTQLRVIGIAHVEEFVLSAVLFVIFG
jgi:hypothetical protein